jgi:glyceraldehyde 3-phosphate dehydrogenase
MAVKIAINGFGRIGRLFYRALLERNMLDNKVEVVVVNDVVPAENLAYLLKFDSIHGRLAVDVKATDSNTIIVGERTLKTLALRTTPDLLPWAEYGVDIVIESTGAFSKKADALGHIKSGAKKVIVSAPSDADVKTIIFGVNENTINNDEIISAASCTTNCLAPLCYVLLKEGFGIEEALMTTNHSYTGSQLLNDGSKNDFREGRSGAINIIPTTTGAASSIGLIFPELKGKLTGMAFRVPTPDVSVVDLTLRTKIPTSLVEINNAFKKASQEYLQGVLGYTDEQVVSSDFVHDSRSSIYDASSCIELNSRFFKLISWYDNEWGYSCRLVDILNTIVPNV